MIVQTGLKQQGQRQQISGLGVGRAIDKVPKQRGGSNDSNQEWEIGNSENDDDKLLKN